MDEKKDMEYIKDSEVVLKNLECESNPQDENEIKRLRFVFDRFDVTWRPKVKKETMMKGMTVKSTVPATMDKLPETFKKILDEYNQKGVLNMKIEYTKMVTEKDGNEQIYRFITSEETLKKWVIVDKEPTEEAVLD